MKSRYRKMAIIGPTLSLPYFLVVAILAFKRVRLDLPGWLWITVGIGAIVLWFLGCRALAKGKGYSQAMLLSGVPLSFCPLGGIEFLFLTFALPVVLLVALPDKFPKSKEVRRSQSRETGD
jgi:hypothetical protein